MRGPDPGDWQYAGDHSFLREPPDVFFIRFSGDVLRHEAVEITDAYEQFRAEGRRTYLLADLTQIGAVPPETRKLMAERGAQRADECAVIFGTSFTTRIAVTLVSRATALIRGEPERSFFVKTEAEARAWIEAHRREHARAGGMR